MLAKKMVVGLISMSLGLVLFLIDLFTSRNTIGINDVVMSLLIVVGVIFYIFGREEWYTKTSIAQFVKSNNSNFVLALGLFFLSGSSFMKEPNSDIPVFIASLLFVLSIALMIFKFNSKKATE